MTVSVISDCIQSSCKGSSTVIQSGSWMHMLETGSTLIRKINLIYRFHKIIEELNRNTDSAVSNKYLSLSGHTHSDKDSTALLTPTPPRF